MVLSVNWILNSLPTAGWLIEVGWIEKIVLFIIFNLDKYTRFILITQKRAPGRNPGRTIKN
jgi:hypothetical protein